MSKDTVGAAAQRAALDDAPRHPQQPFAFDQGLAGPSQFELLQLACYALRAQLPCGHSIEIGGAVRVRAEVDQCRTLRRFRPTVPTPLAAILATIALSRSAFFGPMAVAIMGGPMVATALTLLFLPALYAAWFKVKLPQEA